ncbi:MAG: DUF3422 domain-containing protein [Methylobacteriaceae bacterium]|nr:DUF3422 domain-containing protein [Methylobacteriaceae bacterium]
MNRPPDHPRRAELNDEVHARPPEPIAAPARISYLATISDPARRAADIEALASLAGRLGAAIPPREANHYSADLGSFRLKWERHTEFTRYMFMVGGTGPDPFQEPALAFVPREVVAGLPGQVIAASHVAIRPASEEELDPDAVADRWFGGAALIGSAVGGEAATAYTDFRIQPDGFTRFLIQDRHLAPRQAGRLIQRLLEIDTYKTLALLALPVARDLVPFLKQAESDLAAITNRLADGTSQEEAVLLERLTRLEAEIESRGAENLFRFGASAAYYRLVGQRIRELRETRIEGLQTFGEFVERRLAPAMSTCDAASTRQADLSGRIARANQLLSTRVEVARSRQTNEVLHSMNRRAQLQLRLQETVEGLSVAAITYYVIGLLGYLFKGLKPLGLDVNPEIAMAVSIPIVLVLAALGIRYIRHTVQRQSQAAERGG